MTLVSFSVTNAAAANPAVPGDSQGVPAPFDAADFAIPETLGDVAEKHLAKADAPFVVILQDAHTVIDGQTSIQKIIEFLSAKYGFDLAAVEGAKGKLDGTLISAFPDPILKRKILASYFDRSELTGAGLAVLTGTLPVDFYGLEDWPLYEQNYLAFARSDRNREKNLERIRLIKSGFDAQREKVFSAKLNQLFGEVSKFESDQENILEFIERLKDFLPEAKSDFSDYPEIQKLRASAAREKNVTAAETLAALNRLAAEIKQSLKNAGSVDLTKRFNAAEQSFRSNQMERGQFAAELAAVQSELAPSPRPLPLKGGEDKGEGGEPIITNLLKNQKTLRSIKGTKLFEEIEAAVFSAQTDLAGTPESRDLLKKIEQLNRLERLARLEWTHKDFVSYQADAEAHLVLDSNHRAEYYSALQFYDLALKRDDAFSKRVENLMGKTSRKRMSVIAGGFHAEGLKDALRRKGYSYVLITPRINSLLGSENYEAIMRGNLSFRDQIKTTFYDAFTRHALTRFAAELSGFDLKRTLKVWRDELIRKLANEHRTGDAGKYTAYLDGLAKVNLEKLGASDRVMSKEELIKAIETEFAKTKKQTMDQVWRDFESQLAVFNQGLKQLIERKELNRQNVSALIQRASQAPAALQTLAMVALDPTVSSPLLVDYVTTGKIPAELYTQTDTISLPPASKTTYVDVLKDLSRGESASPELVAAITKVSQDLNLVTNMTETSAGYDQAKAAVTQVIAGIQNNLSPEEKDRVTTGAIANAILANLQSRPAAISARSEARSASETEDQETNEEFGYFMPAAVFESYLSRISNPDETIRKAAIREFFKLIWPRYERVAELFYYQARYITEELAGVPFQTTHEEFMAQGMAEFLEILNEFHTKNNVETWNKDFNSRVHSKFDDKLEVIIRDVWGNAEITITRTDGLLNGLRQVFKDKSAVGLSLPANDVYHALLKMDPLNQQTLDAIRRAYEPMALVGTDVSYAELASLSYEDNVAEEVSSHQLANRINRVLKTLSYREREIIKLRYGLGDGYEFTLKEIGQIFQVTGANIGVIEAKAIRKLQQPSRAQELIGFLPDGSSGYQYWLSSLNDKKILSDLYGINQAGEAVPLDEMAQLYGLPDFVLKAIELTLLYRIKDAILHKELEPYITSAPESQDEIDYEAAKVYVKSRRFASDFRDLSGNEQKAVGLLFDETKQTPPDFLKVAKKSKLTFRQVEILWADILGEVKNRLLMSEIYRDMFIFGSRLSDPEELVSWLKRPLTRSAKAAEQVIEEDGLPGGPVSLREGEELPEDNELTPEGEDALIAFTAREFSIEQQKILPLMLQFKSLNEILKESKLPRDFVKKAYRNAAPTLKLLFTTRAFERFGHNERVRLALIQLFSETKLERMLRRANIGALLEISNGDIDGVLELILLLYPDQFTEKQLREALTGHFKQIAEKAEPAKGLTPRSAPEILRIAKHFFDATRADNQRAKKIALLRMLRNLYYPLIRQDEENKNQAGLDYLKSEAEESSKDPFWQELLSETWSFYSKAMAFQPHGFRGVHDGLTEPLIPAQRYSIYEALQSLENPDEKGALIAGEARIGKTIISALAAFNIKNEKGEYAVKRLLYTTTNQAKYEVQRELSRRLDVGAEIFVLEGTKEEKRALIKKASKSRDKVILIANYESVRDLPDEVSAFAPNAHVIDEINNLRKGDATIRAPIIFGIPSEYRIGISARPIIKGAVDLAAILAWLRPKAFPSAQHVSHLSKDALFSALDVVMSRWRRKVVLPEVGNPEVIREEILFTPVQDAVIKQIRNRFSEWKETSAKKEIKDQQSTFLNQLRFEQWASADLALVMEDEDLSNQSAKIKRLDQIIYNEKLQNGKTVVLVESIEEAERLQARYNTIYGEGAAVSITSNEKVLERNDRIERFRGQPFPLVLIGTSALLGSSLNLFQIPGSDFHISTVVRLSRPWWNVDDGERLLGIGQTHPVKVYSLIGQFRPYSRDSKINPRFSVDQMLDNLLNEEAEVFSHVVDGKTITDSESEDRLEMLRGSLLEQMKGLSEQQSSQDAAGLEARSELRTEVKSELRPEDIGVQVLGPGHPKYAEIFGAPVKSDDDVLEALIRLDAFTSEQESAGIIAPMILRLNVPREETANWQKVGFAAREKRETDILALVQFLAAHAKINEITPNNLKSSFTIPLSENFQNHDKLIFELSGTRSQDIQKELGRAMDLIDRRKDDKSRQALFETLLKFISSGELEDKSLPVTMVLADEEGAFVFNAQIGSNAVEKRLLSEDMLNQLLAEEAVKRGAADRERKKFEDAKKETEAREKIEARRKQLWTLADEFKESTAKSVEEFRQMIREAAAREDIRLSESQQSNLRGRVKPLLDIPAEIALGALQTDESIDSLRQKINSALEERKAELKPLIEAAIDSAKIDMAPTLIYPGLTAEVFDQWLVRVAAARAGENISTKEQASKVFEFDSSPFEYLAGRLERLAKMIDMNAPPMILEEFVNSIFRAAPAYSETLSARKARKQVRKDWEEAVRLFGNVSSAFAHYGERVKANAQIGVVETDRNLAEEFKARLINPEDEALAETEYQIEIFRMLGDSEISPEELAQVFEDYFAQYPELGVKAYLHAFSESHFVARYLLAKGYVFRQQASKLQKKIEEKLESARLDHFSDDFDRAIAREEKEDRDREAAAEANDYQYFTGDKIRELEKISKSQDLEAGFEAALKIRDGLARYTKIDENEQRRVDAAIKRIEDRLNQSYQDGQNSKLKKQAAEMFARVSELVSRAEDLPLADRWQSYQQVFDLVKGIDDEAFENVYNKLNRIFKDISKSLSFSKAEVERNPQPEFIANLLSLYQQASEFIDRQNPPNQVVLRRAIALLDQLSTEMAELKLLLEPKEETAELPDAGETVQPIQAVSTRYGLQWTPKAFRQTLARWEKSDSFRAKFPGLLKKILTNGGKGDAKYSNWTGLFGARIEHDSYRVYWRMDGTNITIVGVYHKDDTITKGSAGDKALETLASLSAAELPRQPNPAVKAFLRDQLSLELVSARSEARQQQNLGNVYEQFIRNFRSAFPILDISLSDLSVVTTDGERLEELQKVISNARKHQLVDLGAAVISIGLLGLETFSPFLKGILFESSFSLSHMITSWVALGPLSVIMFLGGLTHRYHEMKARRIIERIQKRVAKKESSAQKPRSEVRVYGEFKKLLGAEAEKKAFAHELGDIADMLLLNYVEGERDAELKSFMKEKAQILMAFASRVYEPNIDFSELSDENGTLPMTVAGFLNDVALVLFDGGKPAITKDEWAILIPGYESKMSRVVRFFELMEEYAKPSARAEVRALEENGLNEILASENQREIISQWGDEAFFEAKRIAGVLKKNPKLKNELMLYFSKELSLTNLERYMRENNLIDGQKYGSQTFETRWKFASILQDLQRYFSRDMKEYPDVIDRNETLPTVRMKLPSGQTAVIHGVTHGRVALLFTREVRELGDRLAEEQIPLLVEESFDSAYDLPNAVEVPAKAMVEDLFGKEPFAAAPFAGFDALFERLDDFVNLVIHRMPLSYLRKAIWLSGGSLSIWAARLKIDRLLNLFTLDEWDVISLYDAISPLRYDYQVLSAELRHSSIDNKPQIVKNSLPAITYDYLPYVYGGIPLTPDKVLKKDRPDLLAFYRSFLFAQAVREKLKTNPGLSEVHFVGGLGHLLEIMQILQNPTTENLRLGNQTAARSEVRSSGEFSLSQAVPLKGAGKIFHGTSARMPAVAIGEMVVWEPKRSKPNLSVVRLNDSEAVMQAKTANEIVALKKIWSGIQNDLPPGSPVITAMEDVLKGAYSQIIRRKEKSEFVLDRILDENPNLSADVQRLLRDKLIPALQNREELFFLESGIAGLSQENINRTIIDRYKERVMIKLYDVILNLPYGFNTKAENVAENERQLAGYRREKLEKEIPAILAEIEKGIAPKFAFRPSIRRAVDEVDTYRVILERAKEYARENPGNETAESEVDRNQHLLDTAIEQVGYLESISSEYDEYHYLYDINDSDEAKEIQMQEEIKRHEEYLNLTRPYFKEAQLDEFTNKFRDFVTAEIKKGRKIEYGAAKFFYRHREEIGDKQQAFMMRYYDIVLNGDPEIKSEKLLTVFAKEIRNESDYNRLLGSTRSRGRVVAIISPKIPGEIRIPHWYIFAKKSGIVVLLSVDLNEHGLTFSDVPSGVEGMVDGKKGLFVFKPSQEMKARWEQLGKTYEQMDQYYLSLARLPAQFEGQEVPIWADETQLSALREENGNGSIASRSGMKGIGLFRLEEILLDPSRPGIELDKDRLQLALSEILTYPFFKDGAPFVVRLLDVAPDKRPKFLVEGTKGEKPKWNITEVMENFSGIRFYLSKEKKYQAFREFGKLQLKALFGAHLQKDVEKSGLKILVSDVRHASEVEAFEELYEEAKREFIEETMRSAHSKASLSTQNPIEMSKSIDAIPLGYMFEDTLAVRNEREAIFDAIARLRTKRPAERFIGIGSNDLTKSIHQKRMSAETYLDTMNPYLIRDIWMIAKTAKEHGMHVTLEGEWGGSSRMLMALLYLRKMEGVDVTPVSATAKIPELLEMVRRMTWDDLTKNYKESQGGADYEAFANLMRDILHPPVRFYAYEILFGWLKKLFVSVQLPDSLHSWADRLLEEINPSHLLPFNDLNDSASHLQNLFEVGVTRSQEFEDFIVASEEAQEKKALEKAAQGESEPELASAADEAAQKSVPRVEDLGEGKIKETRDYGIGFQGMHTLPTMIIMKWFKAHSGVAAYLLTPDGGRYAMNEMEIMGKGGSRAPVSVEDSGEAGAVKDFFAFLEWIKEFDDYDGKGVEVFDPDLSKISRSELRQSELLENQPVWDLEDLENNVRKFRERYDGINQIVFLLRSGRTFEVAPKHIAGEPEVWIQGLEDYLNRREIARHDLEEQWPWSLKLFRRPMEHEGVQTFRNLLIIVLDVEEESAIPRRPSEETKDAVTNLTQLMQNGSAAHTALSSLAQTLQEDRAIDIDLEKELNIEVMSNREIYLEELRKDRDQYKGIKSLYERKEERYQVYRDAYSVLERFLARSETRGQTEIDEEFDRGLNEAAEKVLKSLPDDYQKAVLASGETQPAAKSELRTWGDWKSPQEQWEERQALLAGAKELGEPLDKILDANGINRNDFTALYYAAAGSDSDLPAVLKEFFPNIREYFLNDISYKESMKNIMPARGEITAGENVKENLTKKLLSKNHKDIDVFTDDSDYLSGSLKWPDKQSAGRSVFVHNWAGFNDALGGNPLFQVLTLERGLLKPGDLVLVRGTAANRNNPFQWSDLIGEQLRISGNMNIGKTFPWAAYRVTEQDFRNADELKEKISGETARSELRSGVFKNEKGGWVIELEPKQEVKLKKLAGGRKAISVFEIWSRVDRQLAYFKWSPLDTGAINRVYRSSLTPGYVFKRRKTAAGRSPATIIGKPAFQEDRDEIRRRLAKIFSAEALEVPVRIRAGNFEVEFSDLTSQKEVVLTYVIWAYLREIFENKNLEILEKAQNLTPEVKNWLIQAAKPGLEAFKQKVNQEIYQPVFAANTSQLWREGLFNTDPADADLGVMVDENGKLKVVLIDYSHLFIVPESIETVDQMYDFLTNESPEDQVFRRKGEQFLHAIVKLERGSSGGQERIRTSSPIMIQRWFPKNDEQQQLPDTVRMLLNESNRAARSSYIQQGYIPEAEKLADVPAEVEERAKRAAYARMGEVLPDLEPYIKKIAEEYIAARQKSRSEVRGAEKIDDKAEEQGEFRMLPADRRFERLQKVKDLWDDENKAKFGEVKHLMMGEYAHVFGVRNLSLRLGAYLKTSNQATFNEAAAELLIAKRLEEILRGQYEVKVIGLGLQIGYREFDILMKIRPRSDIPQAEPVLEEGLYLIEAKEDPANSLQPIIETTLTQQVPYQLENAQILHRAGVPVRGIIVAAGGVTSSRDSSKQTGVLKRVPAAQITKSSGAATKGAEKEIAVYSIIVPSLDVQNGFPDGETVPAPSDEQLKNWANEDNRIINLFKTVLNPEFEVWPLLRSGDTDTAERALEKLQAREAQSSRAAQREMERRKRAKIENTLDRTRREEEKIKWMNLLSEVADEGDRELLARALHWYFISQRNSRVGDLAGELESEYWVNLKDDQDEANPLKAWEWLKRRYGGNVIKAGKQEVRQVYKKTQLSIRERIDKKINDSTGWAAAFSKPAAQKILNLEPDRIRVELQKYFEIALLSPEADQAKVISRLERELRDLVSDDGWQEAWDHVIRNVEQAYRSEARINRKLPSEKLSLAAANLGLSGRIKIVSYGVDPETQDESIGVIEEGAPWLVPTRFAVHGDTELDRVLALLRVLAFTRALPQIDLITQTIIAAFLLTGLAITAENPAEFMRQNRLLIIGWGGLGLGITLVSLFYKIQGYVFDPPILFLKFLEVRNRAAGEANFKKTEGDIQRSEIRSEDDFTPLGLELFDKTKVDFPHYKTLDIRPLRVGLLAPEFIGHDMAVKQIVNPDDRDLVGVYGGSGADFSNFLLSTNAAEGNFIEQTTLTLKEILEAKEKLGSDWSRQFKEGYFRRKSEIGFAGSEYSGIDNLAYKIFYEFEALGVNLNALKITSPEKDVILFEFPWAYHGGAVKPRKIRMIRGDLLKAEEILKKLPSQVDFYYQHAGHRLADNYDRFINIIAGLIKPGGFLVTDDVGSWDWEYYDLDTILKANFSKAGERTNGDLEYYGNLIVSSRQVSSAYPNKIHYGWDVNIRQKQGAAAKSEARAAKASEQRVDLSLDPGSVLDQNERIHIQPFLREIKIYPRKNLNARPMILRADLVKGLVYFIEAPKNMIQQIFGGKRVSFGFDQEMSLFIEDAGIELKVMIEKVSYLGAFFSLRIRNFGDESEKSAAVIWESPNYSMGIQDLNVLAPQLNEFAKSFEFWKKQKNGSNIKRAGALSLNTQADFLQNELSRLQLPNSPEIDKIKSEANSYLKKYARSETRTQATPPTWQALESGDRDIPRLKDYGLFFEHGMKLRLGNLLFIWPHKAGILGGVPLSKLLPNEFYVAYALPGTSNFDNVYDLTAEQTEDVKRRLLLRRDRYLAYYHPRPQREIVRNTNIDYQINSNVWANFYAGISNPEALQKNRLIHPIVIERVVRTIRRMKSGGQKDFRILQDGVADGLLLLKIRERLKSEFPDLNFKFFGVDLNWDAIQSALPQRMVIPEDVTIKNGSADDVSIFGEEVKADYFDLVIDYGLTIKSIIPQNVAENIAAKWSLWLKPGGVVFTVPYEENGQWLYMIDLPQNLEVVSRSLPELVMKNAMPKIFIILQKKGSEAPHQKIDLEDLFKGIEAETDALDSAFPKTEARSEIREEKNSRERVNDYLEQILISDVIMANEVLSQPEEAEVTIRSKAKAKARKLERIWESISMNILAELRQLNTISDIIEWTNSQNLSVVVKNGLEQNGFDPERVDRESQTIALKLTGIIQNVIEQGLTAGTALANAEEPIEINSGLVTPEVKFLLSSPAVLEKAYEEMKKAAVGAGRLGHEGYLIDTALVGENQDLKLIAEKFKLAFSYDSDMPRLSELAKSLVKLFLGSTAIAYNSSRPLNHMSVKRALGSYIGLLDSNVRLGNLPAANVVMTSENLTRRAVPLVGGWEPLLRVAELLLLQAEGQQGPRVLDEKALNGILGLLHALTQTQAAKQAFAQSA